MTPFKRKYDVRTSHAPDAVEPLRAPGILISQTRIKDPS